MKKQYVLDTSSLIFDPTTWKQFPNSDVIIPIAVLNELDKLKKQSGEAGRNARVCIRMLDDISDKLDISTGIVLDDDILLKIDATYRDMSNPMYAGFGDPNYGDTQILACALATWMEHPEHDVTLVSNDINLRVKAKSRNIDAIAHDGKRYSLSDLYSGTQTIVHEEAGLDLLKCGSIDPRGYGFNMSPNECVLFESPTGEGIALGRKVANDKIKLVRKVYPWNIASRNKEQSFAIDLIMDKNVDLVTLIGRAGTGKSLIVLATALELVISRKEYDKFIIYRPIQPVGNDIGYLPGTMEEKLAPWFQAIMDNFELLFGNKVGTDWKRDLEMFQKKGRIEMEAITYIRGRSIPNAIILVDECFPANQYIATENGKEKIGILYKKFKNGKELPLVKSYNRTNGEFEYKKIVNAWNRGKKKLLEVKCANRKIKCTENHRFLTENGWKEASKLQIGELIKTSEYTDHQLLHYLNSDQEQIILGSFLGDGNIANHGRSRFRLRMTHGFDQREYCEWKAGMFGAKTRIIKDNGYSKKLAIAFNSEMFGMNQILPKTKESCPQWVLDKLDVRGLAIWFMDDGTVNADYNGARISTCSFDENSQQRIVKKLQSWGIECSYAQYGGYFYINLTKSGYIKLAQLIAPYMHENMQYKCEKSKQVVHVWDTQYDVSGCTVVDAITYLDLEEEVYDIEVEDNHNFIVCSSSQGKNKTNSGLIAHNCQNLSKEEVKTILTRAGENTKIILTGDIEQIDNSLLDATSNGLTHVIEKFKDSEMAGHITFTQGERSRLASMAAEIL
jgi:PhoH-like ATPase